MKLTSTYLLKKIVVLFVFLTSVQTITLAQWSAPVNISPGAVSASMNESMGSCIGTSGDSVHVVWTDTKNKTKSIIYYARSTDTGLTWTTPIALTDTGISIISLNPAIAVSGRNIHIVWREFVHPGHCGSWYRHSTDGGNTWDPAVFLDSTSDWPAVAVSGNNVYIANDWYMTPTNSQIFIMRSTDNGVTWTPRKQVTFAILRNEDEAITAQGPHVQMSWNANRSGAFQIIYKQSLDYGVTWDTDVVVMPKTDYNTMVSINGAHLDVIASGHPTSNNHQILLSQSADTGNTWAPDMDLTNNDTAHDYYLPQMVRDSCNIHAVCGSNIGGKYFHSGDGGTTWDPPFTFTGAGFVAYSGNAVHIVCVNVKAIYYLRNPTGNKGANCSPPLSINEAKDNISTITVFPNPANKNINVESSTELGVITMYNLLGEVMFTEKVSALQKQIDMSNFPAGIYFLKANNTFTKIVKE